MEKNWNREPTMNNVLSVRSNGRIYAYDKDSPTNVKFTFCVRINKAAHEIMSKLKVNSKKWTMPNWPKVVRVKRAHQKKKKCGETHW